MCKIGKKIEVIISIAFLLIILFVIILLIFEVIPELIKLDYTIQDIHNWCCNNLNDTMSPTGDNCTNVINNIYGGKCS